jgi:hypothetical protein
VRAPARVASAGLTVLAVVAFLLAAPSAGVVRAAVPAAVPVTVFIDACPLRTDQAPVVISGRTLVPVRAVVETLGAVVEYSADTQTVFATRGPVSIALRIGSVVATVNCEDRTLDVPAQIMNGRTMVPLRFIGEILGAVVTWDQQTRTAEVFSSREAAVKMVEAHAATYEQALAIRNYRRADEALVAMNRIIEALSPDPIAARRTLVWPFHAARDTGEYHWRFCARAAAIASDRLVIFALAADAESAGYRPCAACVPSRVFQVSPPGASGSSSPASPSAPGTAPGGPQAP